MDADDDVRTEPLDTPSIPTARWASPSPSPASPLAPSAGRAPGRGTPPRGTATAANRRDRRRRSFSRHEPSSQRRRAREPRGPVPRRRRTPRCRPRSLPIGPTGPRSHARRRPFARRGRGRQPSYRGRARPPAADVDDRDRRRGPMVLAPAGGAIALAWPRRPGRRRRPRRGRRRAPLGLVGPRTRPPRSSSGGVRVARAVGRRRRAPAAVRRLAGRAGAGCGPRCTTGRRRRSRRSARSDLFDDPGDDGDDPEDPCARRPPAPGVGRRRLGRDAGAPRPLGGDWRSSRGRGSSRPGWRALDRPPGAADGAAPSRRPSCCAPSWRSTGCRSTGRRPRRSSPASSGPGPRDAADADAAGAAARDAEVLRHAPPAATVDLRSPGQVKSLLRRVGIEVPDTRAWRLEPAAASTRSSTRCWRGARPSGSPRPTATPGSTSTSAPTAGCAARGRAPTAPPGG